MTILDFDLDDLICLAEADAACPVFVVPKQKKRRNPPWSAEEVAFLRENVGIISYAEISRRLGRSVAAIHLKLVRKGIPKASRVPGYVTSCQVARIMGLDSHIPPGWIDSGVMPGEVIPYESGRVIRRLKVVTFKRWLVKPEHWIYFDVNRIKNRHYRRLVKLAQARWGDEWWGLVRVGEYHGCTSKDVLRYVVRGEVPAIQARNRSGRHKTQGWKLWYMKKSDAVKLEIRTNDSDRKEWGGADAFMILARGIGFSYDAIRRMMGWETNYRPWYRITRLQELGLVEEIIKTNGLKAQYDPESGSMFADWRDYPGRFPAIERAVSHYRAGWIDDRDMSVLRHVLSGWARWHGGPDDPLYRALSRPIGGASYERLSGYVEKIWERFGVRVI